jgi:maleate cis-trans isomerase
MDAMMKAFLEGSGFQVVKIGGLGIRRNSDISKVPEHAAYRFAKKLYREAEEKPDGIFIHCPRWPTIGHIELLEKELECPVVTSSQTMTWWGMKLISIRENITGFGQLMKTLA